MNGFYPVFKVSLFGVFRRSASTSRKSRFSTGIILAIAYVYLAATSFVMFFALGSELAPAGYLFVIPAVAFVVNTVISFLTCISTASGNLIRIRDGDILFSLPVSHRTVLAAKLAVLYVFELIYTLILLLPASAAYFYYGNANAASVIACVISLFAAPLIPMFIGVFASFFGSLVTRRMRHKNIIATVLFLALFCAYFIFASDSAGFINGLMNNAVAIRDSIKAYYFPAALYCNAMDGNVLHSLLLLAAGAIPLIVSLFLFSGVYSSLVSAATSTLQNGSKIKHSEEKAFAASSPLKSFTAKEFKHYFSSVIYMMNTVTSPLMSVLLTILIFTRKEIVSSFSQISSFGSIFAIYVFVSTACICMMPTTASSISLEGKRIWLIHSLPVNKKTVLNAKALMNLIICTVFILINCVLLIVLGGYGILESLSYFIIAFSCASVSSVSGLLINLWKPRLDYVNETQVIKQSIAALLSLLSGALITGAALLIYLAARSFTNTYIARAGIVGIAMLLICYGLLHVLYSTGIRKLDTLS